MVLVVQVYCFMSIIETEILGRLILPREPCFR
jgi:hypothetical protein